MQTGDLPMPGHATQVAQRAGKVRESIEQRYAALGDPDLDLKGLAEMQRKFWKTKETATAPEVEQPTPAAGPDAHRAPAGPEPLLLAVQ